MTLFFSLAQLPFNVSSFQFKSRSIFLRKMFKAMLLLERYHKLLLLKDKLENLRVF